MIASRFGVVALILSASAIPSRAGFAQDAVDGHVVVSPTDEAAAPPWLGVSLVPKRERDGKGVEVSALMRRSPADGTGLAVGDRIIAVAGDPVDLVGELQRAVRRHRAGEKIGVTIVKRGKHQTVSVLLAEQPAPEEIVRNHLVGYPAPDFMMRFVGDGKDVHLSELRGKPTVLEFWATWCGPCHRVQAHLAQVKGQFAERIHIVGVSNESAQVVRAHLERFPAHYAMAVDDSGLSRDGYVVESIPQIVILDAEHNVVSVLFGVSGAEQIEKKLDSLLANP